MVKLNTVNTFLATAKFVGLDNKLKPRMVRIKSVSGIKVFNVYDLTRHQSLLTITSLTDAKKKGIILSGLKAVN